MSSDLRPMVIPPVDPRRPGCVQPALLGALLVLQILDHIAAHETCHLFGACDEYAEGCSCESPCGCLQVANDNCENCPGTKVPCVMLDAQDFTLCPVTRAQIGWRDSDVPPDHAFDPIDHPQSALSMIVGPDGMFEISKGDWVDIWKGTVFKKRLCASEWTLSGGKMLWDGIDCNGDTAGPGTYQWRKRVGQLHNGTLATDTEAPSISDLEIIAGDGLQNTLSFEFTDPDTRSGRVQAISRMPGVADQRVVPDKYYLDTDGAAPPIEVPFEAVHEGMYTLSLRVWDVGGGQYDSDAIPFWTGDLAGASPSRIAVPELSLSRSRPNPSADWVSWDLQMPSAGVVTLRVIGVDGRECKVWPGRAIRPGVTRVLWNGLDHRGQRMPSGRYFLTATDDKGRKTCNAATMVP